jgi:hypothetical protein
MSFRWRMIKAPQALNSLRRLQWKKENLVSVTKAGAQ